MLIDTMFHGVFLIGETEKFENENGKPDIIYLRTDNKFTKKNVL